MIEVIKLEKKIPKVFANKIDKKIENNETYSYTRNDDIFKEKNTKEDNLDINSKINNIFKSSGYIYKIDVNIKLKDGIVDKRIIGKRNGYLITMDNELIKISDILDITIK